MSDNHDDLAKEIVIVKRRRSTGEEAHHGGVWKIAYADFMTAMMAFFLVMWLVNMTDDKTIVQIANYFNPLQLTDRNQTDKGLYDSDPSSEAKSTSDDTKRSQGDKKPRSPGQARMEKARKEKAAAQEAKLFVDPLKTLDGVAKSDDGAIPEAGPEENLVGIDEQAMPRQLLPTGPDTFDPFDPFMEKSMQPPTKHLSSRPKPTGAEAPLSDKKNAENSLVSQPERRAASTKEDETAIKQGDLTENNSSAADATKIVAAAIRKSVEKAIAGLRQARPELQVDVVPEGVLISIMDNDKFAMFKLSSAEPVPEAVRLIDRLGKIIIESKKKVAIRGHTDSRQFKSSSYDNWRLSTARAHMAHYMVRRAGLEDSHLVKIEGFADSQLLKPSDPFAAENRRIEFLLRVNQP